MAVLPVQEVVNSKLSLDERANIQLWCLHTGNALKVLLDNSDYYSDFQYENLELFRQLVAPYLGRFPADNGHNRYQWHSFMTDDGSPVELSWDWGANDGRPKIRYSIEPVGLHAGTPADPGNVFAAPAFQSRMAAFIPEMNLEWFHYFADFFKDTGDEEPLAVKNPLEHKSSVFYAFDLVESATTAKVYFFPKYRATLQGISNLEALSEAIRGAPYCTRQNLQAWSVFSNFALDAASRDIEYEMLAIDMIDPLDSRLKIYFRSRETSFDSVANIMTLGGRLMNPALSEGLRNLYDLWNGLFGPCESQSQPLRNNGHRTAGILYNMEFRLGDTVPVTKVYLPVRHYARSDRAVIEALADYFATHQRGRYMGPYRNVMTELFGDFRLAKQTGIHTYIGCTLQPSGDLRIVSYFKTPVSDPYGHRNTNFPG